MDSYDLVMYVDNVARALDRARACGPSSSYHTVRAFDDRPLECEWSRIWTWNSRVRSALSQHAVQPWRLTSIIAVNLNLGFS